MIEGRCCALLSFLRAVTLSLGFFFEPGPGLALPGRHSVLVALDGTTLGLLHREAQTAKDAPDLRLAELDAIQAFDENAHTLEGPQLGAKTMRGRTLQQGAAQSLQLRLVQSRWPPPRGHRAQCIDAALIEHRLPGVCRLARYAHRVCNLCRGLARQQHSTRSQAPPYRLVQPLRRHVSHPILAKYRYNA
jgi:hypothetical protein